MEETKQKKNNVITIRIEESLKIQIERQAQKEHRETSEFVRHCIKIYLEKIEEVRRITL